MNSAFPDQLLGGRNHYGQVAGILSLHSSIPRLPGDPGHAQSFDFPVLYSTVEGVGIEQLIAIDETCVAPIIDAARRLQDKGVCFITTSCGLYAPFQKLIADVLDIPFISSGLQMLPMLKGFLPAHRKAGLITGHSGLLTNEHLVTSGFSLDQVQVKGMQNYPEFRRAVLEGAQNMDVKRMRRDVINAASSLKNSCDHLGLVVLECPNLIPFRTDIQQVLKVPVFDIVNLACFFADAYRCIDFNQRFIEVV